MMEDDDLPYVTQDADGDNWYFDMRGAVVGLDPKKTMDDLWQDLDHFRTYLEVKKREWVYELVLRLGNKGLDAALYNDLKLIRAQLENCKSVIISRRGRPASFELDVEWPRRAIARIKPEILTLKQQRNDAAVLMKVRWRTRASQWNNNRVLILQNENDHPIHFILRCIALDNTKVDLTLSMKANNSIEVGFREGWTANWVAGERFEIWTLDNPVLAWHAQVPDS